VCKGANAEPDDTAQGSPRIGELIVACDQRMQTVIAERLRTHQWIVALRGGTQSPASDRPLAASGAGHCVLVGLPAASHARALLDAIGPAGAGPRTVVNLCVMPTPDSVELAQALHADGDAYVDAAFTGRRRDLEQGRGAVLVSAPVALFEPLKPLLEPLGHKVFRISSKAGAAHLMRNIDQCMADALLGAACESYVVGAKAGIDPLDMVKILGVETGKCTATIHILPKLVAERNFDFGRNLGDACDELVILSEEARRLGVTTWILDKVRLLYALAAQLGDREDDVSRLAVIYEKWAGVEIRAGLGKTVAIG
jgi:3-hydroxyisobutyrate dehydrogenase-like beta-hydroxyacid dehydrogenase